MVVRPQHVEQLIGISHTLDTQWHITSYTMEVFLGNNTCQFFHQSVSQGNPAMWLILLL